MNLLHMTQIPKPKKKPLAGVYLLEGTRYIVTPMRQGMIQLRAHNPNGKCFFAGCTVTRSRNFIARHAMTRL